MCKTKILNIKEVSPTWIARPSTTHQISTGGFEFDVEHSKFSSSPLIASEGPDIRTSFGPSEDIISISEHSSEDNKHYTLTLDNGCQLRLKGFENEFVLGLTRVDGVVVLLRRGELVSVFRPVEDRCVGRVDSFAVAIPSDRCQGVSTLRETNQCHCVALLQRLLVTVSLYLRLARRI